MKKKLFLQTATKVAVLCGGVVAVLIAIAYFTVDRRKYRNPNEVLARVERNGKWGYINTTGREVIRCKYEEAGDFRDGRARVKLNDKWDYIDIKGKDVIPLEYEGAEDFCNGLA